MLQSNPLVQDGAMVFHNFVINTKNRTIPASVVFSVADGNHLHSDSSGVFGNPINTAEIGRYLSEEVRGFAKFNITETASISKSENIQNNRSGECPHCQYLRPHKCN